MKRINHWRLLGVAVSTAAGFSLSTSTTVFAQEAEENRVLEEITVTARKRVEKIQDLAMSLSAVGQQEIENNFAADLRDLVYISPNLLLDDTSQGPGGARPGPFAQSRTEHFPIHGGQSFESQLDLPRQLGLGKNLVRLSRRVRLFESAE